MANERAIKPFPQDEYFAALPEMSVEFASAVMDRWQRYNRFLLRSGLATKIGNSLRTYYGIMEQGTFQTAHRLGAGGKAGEVTMTHVAHYRSLIQNILSIITQQKVEFKAKATNTDLQSINQATLADGIVPYFIRSKKMDRQIRKSTELAIAGCEGFVVTEWDDGLGKTIAVDPTNPDDTVKAGDLFTSTGTMLDMARDYSVDSWEDCQWKIFRRRFHRWNSAAKWPEYADRFKQLPGVISPMFGQGVIDRDGESDYVYGWTLFHEPTDAVPNGRYAIVFDSDFIVQDGALPYKQVPIARCAAGEILQTAFGYSTALDLLPMQFVFDAILSAIVTNNMTFGLQHLWMQSGDAVSPGGLNGGLRFLKSKTQPVPLQLVKSSPESYQLLQQCIQWMEVTLGSNSVVRGQPDASLKSGAALALVASQAIIYSSGLQYSYVQQNEDVATHLIQILQKFPKAQLLAEVAGKNDRYKLQSFKKDEIAGVERVTVELTNEAFRTTQGRMAIGQTLLETGVIKDPSTYDDLIRTGNLQTMTEGEEQITDNIRRENELLASDDPKEFSLVLVLPTDRHDRHIAEHDSELSNPEIRMNPAKRQRLLAHRDAHVQVWASLSPAQLAAMQLPPLPIAPPMAPPGQLPPPPEAAGDATPLPMRGDGPQMPNMPNLPPGSPPQAEAAMTQMEQALPPGITG